MTQRGIATKKKSVLSFLLLLWALVWLALEYFFATRASLPPNLIIAWQQDFPERQKD